MKIRQHLILIGVTFGLTVSAMASSDLQTLYGNYLSSVRQLKSDESPQDKASNSTFNKKWLQIFEKALATASGNDPGRRQILAEMMALNAAVGDIDQAYVIDSTLIESAKTPSESELLRINLAELSYEMFQKGRTQEELDQAEQNFQKAADSIMDSTIAGDALDFLTKKGNFEVQIGKPEAAVFSYLKAEQILVDKTGNGSKLQSIAGFTQEMFVQKAVEAAYSAQNGKLADSLFSKLISLSDAKRSPSYYFYYFSKYKDPAYGSSFRSSSMAWLKAHPNDPWNDMLRFYMARSYFADKMYEPAAQIYSELLQSPIVDMSGTSLEKKGITYEVLMNLSSCMVELGQREESRKISAMAETLKK